MKNRKVEITEFLTRHDARRHTIMTRNGISDISVNLFEVLLEEAFAEGYSFAKEEAKLVLEAAEVLGK